MEKGILKKGDIVKFNSVAKSQEATNYDTKQHIVGDISPNGESIFFEDGGASNVFYLDWVGRLQKNPLPKHKEIESLKKSLAKANKRAEAAENFLKNEIKKGINLEPARRVVKDRMLMGMMTQVKFLGSLDEFKETLKKLLS